MVATLAEMRIDAATRSMLKDVAALYQRSTKCDTEKFFLEWDRISGELRTFRATQPGTMQIENFFAMAKRLLLSHL